MNEITIVTAFYDIGRAGWKGFERSARKYLGYFEFWAGLDNELVVYTSKEFENEILKIRKKCKLEHKTKVIVKDYKSFDLTGLKGICKTFKEYDQSLNRTLSSFNLPEITQPLYCYITYLKPLVVTDAIERGLTSDKIMWLDFGFNHGGFDLFTDKEQFNFTLKAQSNLGLDELKINCFKLYDDVDGMNMPNVYLSDKFSIAGPLFYGNKKAWLAMSKDFYEALRIFLSFNIANDDQGLIEWCIRNKKEHYNILKCYTWCDSLFFFIPEKLNVNINTNRPSKYQKMNFSLTLNLYNENQSLKIDLENLQKDIKHLVSENMSLRTSLERSKESLSFQLGNALMNAWGGGVDKFAILLRPYRLFKFFFFEVWEIRREFRLGKKDKK